jgi:hypothetical protein
MNRVYVAEDLAQLADVFPSQDCADIEVASQKGRAMQHGGETADNHEIDFSVAQAL